MFLKPLAEDEESYKLLYTFTKENNPMWKQVFLKSVCKEKINLETLSDFEYFKLLYNTQKTYESVLSKNYMLIINGKPLVNIYIMMRTSNIADISFITHRNHRKKGFATIALNMIEQMLFCNPNILFTTIMDLTPNKITSKIALKSGYTFNEDTNYFIKANPNINLEDLIENKR